MEHISTIPEALQHQVMQRPNAIALIDIRHGETLTFAQLAAASGHVATQLTQAGLHPGDAVLIFQPMSAKLYTALLALFQLGMMAMFVDPSAGLQHLERCCQIYPPKAFIATPKAHLLRLISPQLRQIPHSFSLNTPLPFSQTLLYDPTASISPRLALHSLQPSTPALLTFTSGSTGRPKAALRTHGFLLAQQAVLQSSLQLTAGEIDLTTLPIFVLANLAAGVTSLIPNVDLRFPGKVNATAVIRQIQQYQPTSTAASPAFLERLAAACEQKMLELASFRRIFSGGAPVFPNLLKRLQAIAPQSQITAVYGSTEAEPIAHVTLAEMQSADFEAIQQGGGLLAGHPVPEIHLRVIANQTGTVIPALSQADFDAMAVSVRQIGEIVVSGAHVLPGYWQGQGDEETKFRVAGIPWHRTGDAGYLDEQGRLWLMGRCGARLLDEQGELYPFAVEAAIAGRAGIHRTALVTQHGKRLLLVEGTPEATDPASLQHIQQQLEWAKLDECRAFKNIPVDKRHNAKIDYPALYRKLSNQ